MEQVGRHRPDLSHIGVTRHHLRPPPPQGVSPSCPKFEYPTPYRPLRPLHGGGREDDRPPNVDYVTPPSSGTTVTAPGLLRPSPANPETGLVMQVPETDPVMEDFVGATSNGRDPKDVIVSPSTCGTTDMKTFVQMDVMQVVRKGSRSSRTWWSRETSRLKDDALKCYSIRRPDSRRGCRDFRDDSKRIGAASSPGRQVHLCLCCLGSGTRWVLGGGSVQIRDLAGVPPKFFTTPSRESGALGKR